jgi:hypothetical protein
MGYYVETVTVNFRIPAANIPFAFDVLKNINKPEFDHQKRGGSYSGGKTTAKWYSWMPERYDLQVHSVKDVFELLGFEGCTEDSLGFVLGTYDNKTGQEDLFLAAVAPFAADGLIRWKGEDGSIWENHFEKGVMTTKMLTNGGSW